MTIHPSLALTVKPGIHDTKFSLMVERLVQCYPMAFGILVPHDNKIALMRLQSGLCLAPHFCSEVYCFLAESYMLTPAEITRWWVRRHDVSLGDLYQRLWHEAGMAETAFYRDEFNR